MKVVHLWKSDSPRGGGGGAVAMVRLHEGLKRAGMDSRVLCELKTGDGPDIIQLPSVRPWERRLQKFTRAMGLNDVHRFSSFRLHRHPSIRHADIVTLHGTHHGFINYLALPRLSREKPLVFVLHDMWAMTGHCAVADECPRWRRGCGNCPSLDTAPAVRRDGTAMEWRLKKWVWEHTRMTVVSPSSGLAALARVSMLSGLPVVQISHGIDTTLYRPLDRAQCKSLLGIPPQKRVLMFSSVDLGDKQKGGDRLLSALRSLPTALRRECMLLTLGQGGGAMARAADIPCYDAGFVADDRLKALLYSAADIFVFPSRGEAFGLVLLESMACGTPVLAFDIEGITDLVRDGVTGYRVPRGNAQQLAARIAQLLEDDNTRQRLGEQCIRLVQAEFTLERQVESYRNLYRRTLEGYGTAGQWSREKVNS